MLTSALLLLYNIILAWCSGIAVQAALGKFTKQQYPAFHPSITILLGWIYIAFILQFVHLFKGIDYQSHVLIWLLNALMFYMHKPICVNLIAEHKNVLKQIPNLGLWMVLLMVAAIVNILGRAGVGDIADYHLQAIQWDEKYHVIKGLGNLRRQLGNNSTWFLLHAFAGMHFLGLKSVYVLNAALLVVSCIYLIPHPQQQNRLLKTGILTYIILMSFRKYVGAVTNDYAITIYTLLLFTEWIERHETFTKKLPLVLIIMMLPMHKLSAMVMLLIVIWYLYKLLIKPQSLRELFLIIIIGLLMYIPWLYTTYLQSGYLVYPIEQTGFFNPDWKMREATLVYEKTINMANERAAGLDTNEAMKLSFAQWFPYWIKHLDIFSKLLLGLFMLLPFVCVIKMRKQIASIITKINKESHPSLILFATIALAMPVWFVNAPATRFVFGYMVFTIALCVQYLLGNKSVFSILQRFSYVLILILGANMVLFVKQYLPVQKITTAVITPAPYGSNQMFLHELKKGYIYTPSFSEQCWDADIPCTSIIETGLEWRGEELGEGFRIASKPLEE